MKSEIDPTRGFESIVANMSDALVGADARGKIMLFNPAAERMFGVRDEQVLGQGLECLMPESYRAGHANHMAGYFMRSEKSDLLGKPRRMIGLRSDGSEFPMELLLTRGWNDSGRFVLAFIRDISEREEAERALLDSEKRYERAVNGSRDGIWDWDLETNTVYYAKRWQELLGIEDPTTDNTPDLWFRHIAPDSLSAFQDKIAQHIEGQTQTLDTELEMRHADGTMRWMLCRAIATRDASGKAIGLSGTLSDITELKHTQEELRRIGEHDRLTGLPNRSVMSARIEQCLARARAEAGYTFALLFFDFDRFKVVNDGLGHNAGDELLTGIAERFREHAQPSDTVARFGGDEFVLLLDGVSGLEEVEQMCRELVRAFAKPHHIQGCEIVSTASIGVTLSDNGYAMPDEMIRDADTAMYDAKSAGKNTYRLFDEAMHARLLEQIDLERDLRRKPFEREFTLAYQPIVSLESGCVAGFEALLRWEHPDRGTLLPGQFIDMAEETGLIIPLGEYVLHSACQQISAWRAGAGRDTPLFVNVNISKRQLAHPELLDTLQRIIDRSGISTGDLRLEVTESSIMDDRHNLIPTMQKIREMGIRLAMDDFGTGLSSLSSLHRFPIDILKIDRSFIVNIEQDRQFAAVVQSIILLAQNMDMSVVAEGVENWNQLAQLQSMDCEFAQGYLFARALSAEEATAYLGRKIQKRTDHLAG